MERFAAYLSDAFQSARLADVLDVLLVAVFVFAILEWLRRSGPGSVARRAVVLGVPLLLILIIANRFQLYLVGTLVRLLLLVLPFALILVFQTDLRRFLDRVGSWRFERRPSPPPEGRTGTVVAATAAKLAESRIGALIAIRGREPWGSHITGGIELNGTISRPLLYSIFSPDTPGHDGAVLVENDRVTRFGVHLPLSNRLPPESSMGGTRHSAALGLSEECDALIVVVSEERGMISVARDGVLKRVDSAAELQRHLDEFWTEQYGRREAIQRRRVGLRAGVNAALALMIATGAWLAFAYSAATLQRTFIAPIAFRDLPPEWVLEEDSILEARVALTGSELAFRTFDPSDLVIAFDLSEPEPGVNELTIGEENIEIPSGLSLSYVDPQTVTVVARRYVAVEAPVLVRTTIAVPDTIRLVPDPRTVTVLIPLGTLDIPERVSTEPIEVGFPLPPGGTRARLSLPPGLRLAPNESSEISVTAVRRNNDSRR